MSFIHREKLIQEAETCRETTDAFVSLIQSQPNVAIHINLNDTVKFRLTDYGKDIFYHRFDEVNTKIRKRGGKLIEPNMPKVDSDGYTRMQLWQFMELFGPHTGMAMKTTLSLLKSFMEVEPMIFTSYFGKLSKLPSNVVPISICGKAPDWYTGLQYKKLAPKYQFFMEWKRTHDNAYYVEHFEQEVLVQLNADTVFKELSALSGGQTFALICYERPSDFCHRHLVAEWFCKNGYRCEEIDI